LETARKIFLIGPTFGEPHGNRIFPAPWPKPPGGAQFPYGGQGRSGKVHRGQNFYSRWAGGQNRHGGCPGGMGLLG